MRHQNLPLRHLSEFNQHVHPDEQNLKQYVLRADEIKLLKNVLPIGKVRHLFLNACYKQNYIFLPFQQLHLFTTRGYIV